MGSKRANIIKVQCVSTKCGEYLSLKLGKWYLAKDYKDYYILYEDGLTSDIGYYEKILFRTLEERRDNRLDKIFKNS